MEFQLVYASGLEKMMREKNALLIDIRDTEDYRKDHVRFAVNYPYEEIESGKIRLPKNRFLILYCEHGGTSMELARSLGSKGYHVATVVGGMESMKKVLKSYFKNP